MMLIFAVGGFMMKYKGVLIMNILNIKTFLNIVRYQSISGAAQAMYTSQPSVSSRLHQLEEELGFQLIKRSKGQRTIELTPKGRSFIPLAEHWLELDDQTVQFCQESGRETLTLAAPGSIQEHVVPQIVDRLLRSEQPPRVRLRTANSPMVYSQVASREADVGLALRLLHEDGIIAIPMFDVPNVLLCPADTPLPNEEIHPSQLDPRFEVSVTSWTGETRRWHDHYWDPSITPYIQVDYNHMTHNYLTHPNTWAVCPASVAISVERRRRGEVVIRRLDPAPPKHVCYLVTMRSQLKAQAELIDRLRQSILEYAEEVPWMRPIRSE